MTNVHFSFPGERSKIMRCDCVPRVGEWVSLDSETPGQPNQIFRVAVVRHHIRRNSVVSITVVCE